MTSTKFYLGFLLLFVICVVDAGNWREKRWTKGLSFVKFRNDQVHVLQTQAKFELATEVEYIEPESRSADPPVMPDESDSPTEATQVDEFPNYTQLWNFAPQVTPDIIGAYQYLSEFVNLQNSENTNAPPDHTQVTPELFETYHYLPEFSNLQNSENTTNAPPSKIMFADINFSTEETLGEIDSLNQLQNTENNTNTPPSKKQKVIIDISEDSNLCNPEPGSPDSVNNNTSPNENRPESGNNNNNATNYAKLVFYSGCVAVGGICAVYKALDEKQEVEEKPQQKQKSQKPPQKGKSGKQELPRNINSIPGTCHYCGKRCGPLQECNKHTDFFNKKLISKWGTCKHCERGCPRCTPRCCCTQEQECKNGISCTQHIVCRAHKNKRDPKNLNQKRQ